MINPGVVAAIHVAGVRGEPCGAVRLTHRPLPDNTQHSQQTNIHAPGGIRTQNLSRRAAKNLCLRPRGHWDRQYLLLLLLFSTVIYATGICYGLISNKYLIL